MRNAVMICRIGMMQTPLSSRLLLGASFLLLGCSKDPPATREAAAGAVSSTPSALAAAVAPPPGSQTASSPAGVSLIRAPEGGIQPQAVVDDQRTVHLVYFKGNPAAGDVFYARRRAGENSWSSPLRVNSHPESAIAMGTIRGAQLAVGRDNRVHVAWNGSEQAQPRGSGRKNDSPMLYTRLNDEGMGFEPQRNLIHEAYGLDGGGTVAADPAGNVYVAWHAPGAADGEQNRRVYLAVSRDEGRTFAAEVPVFEPTGACGCCGMKAFAAGDGTLFLLYRSAAAGVNRDMYLLVSRDHGRSFEGTVAGKWQIAACPMSSEAFAEGPEGVVAAWETAGQVFLGWINPKNVAVERRMSPAGSGRDRKHPAVAVNRHGETVFVWTEGTGWKRGGEVAWQVYDAAGRPTKQRGRQEGVPVWSLATAFVDGEDGFTIVY